MDAKPLWTVLHMPGVGRMRSLRLLDIPWMEGQTRETVRSQSLTAGMIRLRGLERIVKLLSWALS